MEKNRAHYLNLFNTEFEKLNDQQRLAVETTEGPVMVVAGPGTGKTQVLSTRIAYIIKEGIAEADNILCLTYTEAGAFAMQKRLYGIIGQLASKISIHTFHSFCNRVISENPSTFNIKYDYRLAEKIDEYEILESLLEELTETDVLYRPDQRYESSIRGILELFQTIKKENWDPDYLKKSIIKQIEDLKFDEKFIYQRNGKNYKKGDLKINDYNKECDKYRKTLSALDLYNSYNENLRKQSLYDFNDLINLVIQEFQKNEQLLGMYQEKFQYILVDEFQDTNGSQLEILKLLISYWENPNVFVVGDSDQAIFRFQGANIANLKNFKNEYLPLTIELVENYRSTQQILSLAEEFVSLNKDRMKEENYQSLHSNSNLVDKRPELRIYTTAYEEIIDIADQIQDAIQVDKIAPEKIAVLFRKNSDAEPIAKELSMRNIPYSFSKEINVLKHPLIKSIFLILEYLEAEYKNPYQNDHILYEILHAPYIDLGTRGIGSIAMSLRKIEKTESEALINKSIRYILSDKAFLESANVENQEVCIYLAKILNSLIQEKQYYTIQILIEKILYDFGIIKFILNESDSMELLEIVNSFFEYVKNLSAKNPDITISTIEEHIRKLQKYNLTIPFINITGNGQFVRLSTIHSAKGLEFRNVYIINNVKRRNSNSYGFKLPQGFSYRGDGVDNEEDRRLFYVGLTRAEQNLKVSFAETDFNGKSKERSEELLELDVLPNIQKIKIKIPAEKLQNGLITRLSFYRKKHELIHEEKIDNFLENFELSVTSLEKFLRCPIAFYYEKILRVPGARNVYMGFGKAVHSTLEDYYRKHKTTEEPNYNELEDLYQKNLHSYSSHFTKEEFKGYLQLGKEVIPKFILNFKDEWKNTVQTKVEVDFHHRFYKDVPISGKLDRIDELAEGIRIIDYKTGNSEGTGKKDKIKGPSERDPIGGEYWRQMIFYAILNDTELKRKEIKEGLFYYIIPAKDGTYKKVQIPINDNDKEIVGQQITLVYSKIKNKEFKEGCNLEDCRWCNYVNKGSINENSIEIVEEY
ncbi:MAG: ATP-dependent helicase [Saprospiraceae bacterium]|nr:ATP-dependent helicase [Saprospiraceae bacterium]